jgi:hypothetical protein
MVRERLRVAQTRQKSYADKRRRIGFGVTGMEFVGVMPTVQGLSGAMLEACG